MDFQESTKWLEISLKKFNNQEYRFPFFPRYVTLGGRRRKKIHQGWISYFYAEKYRNKLLIYPGPMREKLGQ